MNKILRSLRKMYPKANFSLMGMDDKKQYYRIGVDQFILLDAAFLVRQSRLTKQFDTKFLIIFTGV